MFKAWGAIVASFQVQVWFAELFILKANHKAIKTMNMNKNNSNT